MLNAEVISSVWIPRPEPSIQVLNSSQRFSKVLKWYEGLPIPQHRGKVVKLDDGRVVPENIPPRLYSYYHACGYRADRLIPRPKILRCPQCRLIDSAWRPCATNTDDSDSPQIPLTQSRAAPPNTDSPSQSTTHTPPGTATPTDPTQAAPCAHVIAWLEATTAAIAKLLPHVDGPEALHAGADSILTHGLQAVTGDTHAQTQCHPQAVLEALLAQTLGALAAGLHGATLAVLRPLGGGWGDTDTPGGFELRCAAGPLAPDPDPDGPPPTLDTHAAIAQPLLSALGLCACVRDGRGRHVGDCPLTYQQDWPPHPGPVLLRDWPPQGPKPRLFGADVSGHAAFAAPVPRYGVLLVLLPVSPHASESELWHTAEGLAATAGALGRAAHVLGEAADVVLARDVARWLGALGRFLCRGIRRPQCVGDGEAPPPLLSPGDVAPLASAAVDVVCAVAEALAGLGTAGAVLGPPLAPDPPRLSPPLLSHPTTTTLTLPPTHLPYPIPSLPFPTVRVVCMPLWDPSGLGIRTAILLYPQPWSRGGDPVGPAPSHVTLGLLEVLRSGLNAVVAAAAARLASATVVTHPGLWPQPGAHGLPPGLPPRPPPSAPTPAILWTSFSPAVAAPHWPAPIEMYRDALDALRPSLPPGHRGLLLLTSPPLGTGPWGGDMMGVPFPLPVLVVVADTHGHTHPSGTFGAILPIPAPPQAGLVPGGVAAVICQFINRHIKSHFEALVVLGGGAMADDVLAQSPQTPTALRFPDRTDPKAPTFDDFLCATDSESSDFGPESPPSSARTGPQSDQFPLPQMEFTPNTGDEVGDPGGGEASLLTHVLLDGDGAPSGVLAVVGPPGPRPEGLAAVVRHTAGALGVVRRLTALRVGIQYTAIQAAELLVLLSPHVSDGPVVADVFLTQPVGPPPHVGPGGAVSVSWTLIAHGTGGTTRGRTSARKDSGAPSSCRSPTYTLTPQSLSSPPPPSPHPVTASHPLPVPLTALEAPMGAGAAALDQLQAQPAAAAAIQRSDSATFAELVLDHIADATGGGDPTVIPVPTRTPHPTGPRAHIRGAIAAHGPSLPSCCAVARTLCAAWDEMLLPTPLTPHPPPGAPPVAVGGDLLARGPVASVPEGEPVLHAEKSLPAWVLRVPKLFWMESVRGLLVALQPTQEGVGGAHPVVVGLGADSPTSPTPPAAAAVRGVAVLFGAAPAAVQDWDVAREHILRLARQTHSPDTATHGPLLDRIVFFDPTHPNVDPRRVRTAARLARPAIPPPQQDGPQYGVPAVFAVWLTALQGLRLATDRARRLAHRGWGLLNVVPDPTHGPVPFPLSPAEYLNHRPRRTPGDQDGDIGGPRGGSRGVLSEGEASVGDGLMSTTITSEFRVAGVMGCPSVGPGVDFEIRDWRTGAVVCGTGVLRTEGTCASESEQDNAFVPDDSSLYSDTGSLSDGTGMEAPYPDGAFVPSHTWSLRGVATAPV